MTKILNNTNISELMQISAGNMNALDKLADAFRKRAEESAMKLATTVKDKKQAKSAESL